MITIEKTLESKFVIIDPVFKSFPFGQVRPISRVSGNRVYFFTGENYEKEKWTQNIQGFCDTQEEVDAIREFSKEAANRLWALQEQIRKERDAFYTNVIAVG